MILGLPLDAWLLLTAAVGLGLALELAFLRGRRRETSRRGSAAGDTSRDDGEQSAEGGT